MLTTCISVAVGTMEGLLALAALVAGCHVIKADDAVEGSVSLGLMVLGAFCLVALDAARRGAGL